MKAKLLRYTLFLSVIPFSGIFIMLSLKSSAFLMNTVLVVLTAFQAMLIILYKESLKPLIYPDTNKLLQFGVKYVPVAYEPGKYKIDSRVASFSVWFGLLPPILTRIAILFPQTVTIDVLNNYEYRSPSTTLLIFAFFFLVIGAMAFPLWFEITRSAAIFAEGSDKKRYLMMGFVDKLDECRHIKPCQFERIKKR